MDPAASDRGPPLLPDQHSYDFEASMRAGEGPPEVPIPEPQPTAAPPLTAGRVTKEGKIRPPRPAKKLYDLDLTPRSSMRSQMLKVTALFLTLGYEDAKECLDSGKKLSKFGKEALIKKQAESVIREALEDYRGKNLEQFFKNIRRDLEYPDRISDQFIGRVIAKCVDKKKQPHLVNQLEAQRIAREVVQNKFQGDFMTLSTWSHCGSLVRAGRSEELEEYRTQIASVLQFFDTEEDAKHMFSFYQELKRYMLYGGSDATVEPTTDEKQRVNAFLFEEFQKVKFDVEKHFFRTRLQNDVLVEKNEIVSARLRRLVKDFKKEFPGSDLPPDHVGFAMRLYVKFVVSKRTNDVARIKAHLKKQFLPSEIPDDIETQITRWLATIPVKKKRTLRAQVLPAEEAGNVPRPKPTSQPVVAAPQAKRMCEMDLTRRPTGLTRDARRAIQREVQAYDGQMSLQALISIIAEKLGIADGEGIGREIAHCVSKKKQPRLAQLIEAQKIAHELATNKIKNERIANWQAFGAQFKKGALQNKQALEDFQAEIRDVVRYFDQESDRQVLSGYRSLLKKELFNFGRSFDWVKEHDPVFWPKKVEAPGEAQRAKEMQVFRIHSQPDEAVSPEDTPEEALNKELDAIEIFVDKPFNEAEAQNFFRKGMIEVIRNPAQQSNTVSQRLQSFISRYEAKFSEWPLPRQLVYLVMGDYVKKVLLRETTEVGEIRQRLEEQFEIDELPLNISAVIAMWSAEAKGITAAPKAVVPPSVVQLIPIETKSIPNPKVARQAQELERLLYQENSDNELETRLSDFNALVQSADLTDDPQIKNLQYIIDCILNPVQLVAMWDAEDRSVSMRAMHSNGLRLATDILRSDEIGTVIMFIQDCVANGDHASVQRIAKALQIANLSDATYDEIRQGCGQDVPQAIEDLKFEIDEPSILNIFPVYRKKTTAPKAVVPPSVVRLIPIEPESIPNEKVAKQATELRRMLFDPKAKGQLQEKLQTFKAEVTTSGLSEHPQVKNLQYIIDRILHPVKLKAMWASKDESVRRRATHSMGLRLATDIRRAQEIREIVRFIQECLTAQDYEAFRQIVAQLEKVNLSDAIYEEIRQEYGEDLPQELENLRYQIDQKTALSCFPIDHRNAEVFSARRNLKSCSVLAKRQREGGEWESKRDKKERFFERYATFYEIHRASLSESFWRQLEADYKEVFSEKVTSANLEKALKETNKRREGYLPKSSKDKSKKVKKVSPAQGIVSHVWNVVLTQYRPDEIVDAIARSDDPGGLLSALLCKEQIMNNKEEGDAIRTKVLGVKGERKAQLQTRLENAETCVEALLADSQTKLRLDGEGLKNVRREARTAVSRVGSSKESQQAIRHLFKTIKEYSAVCDTLEERNRAKGILCTFVRSVWGSAVLKNNPEIQSTQSELLLALDRPKPIPGVPRWMSEDQLIKMYVANSDPAIRLNGLLSYRWFFKTKDLFTKLNDSWDSFSHEEREAISHFFQEWLNDEAIHARDYVNPEIFSQLTLLADKIENDLSSTTLKGQIEEIQKNETFIAEQETRSKFRIIAEKDAVNVQDILDCAKWVTDQFYPASNDTKKEVMDTIIAIRSRAIGNGMRVDALDSAIEKIVYKENQPTSPINLNMGSEKLTDALEAIFSGKKTDKEYESLVDNIAKDIRLLDSYLSSNLQIDELCNKSYQKELAFEDNHIRIKGTHTLDAMGLSTRISNFLAQIVIENFTPENSERIAKFVVDLVEKLHEMGDFNGILGVLPGFNKDAVHRLKLSEKLAPDYQEKLDRLIKLTSSDKSYKKLKEEEQNLSVNAKQFLPFLGAKLSALVGKDEGNKSKSQEGLNARKLQLVSYTNCEILRLIESATSIREGKDTLHFDLTELLYGQLKDNLYEMSIKKRRRIGQTNPLIAKFDELLEQTRDEKRDAIKQMVTEVDEDTILEVLLKEKRKGTSDKTPIKNLLIEVTPEEKTVLMKVLCQRRLANEQQDKFKAVFEAISHEEQDYLVKELERRERAHRGKYRAGFIEELKASMKPAPEIDPLPELAEVMKTIDDLRLQHVSANEKEPPPLGLPAGTANEELDKLMAQLASTQDILDD